MCSFGLAVNERRKQGEEWVEVPNFFRVTCWRGLAENVSNYLHKGSGIMLDGKLRWSKYQDREGNDRESVEVVADNIQFMPKGSGGGGDGQQQQQQEHVPADTTGMQQPTTVSDDDIPF